MANERYLTKSRFKTALDCPTKLYYQGKPHQFEDRSSSDAFLEALADGGFQVGELAKLTYPGGVEITAPGNAEALLQTAALLEQHTVTLYEAAIAYGLFLVRVDILQKIGDQVNLIEVKAKSFASDDPHAFRSKRGRLNSAMLPYLQDVAFQKHVVRLAYPHWKVRAQLMLPDTQRRCTVDGLNQQFKICRAEGGSQRVVVSPSLKAFDLGDPILVAADIDEHVDDILAGTLETAEGDLPFSQVVQSWAEHHAADVKLPPVIKTRCGHCEFRAQEGSPHLSGYHICWQEAKGLTRDEVDRGTALDLWSFARKQELIDRGVLRLSDVTPEDLKLREDDDGLSNSQRQWMQVSGQWPGGGDFYLDCAYLKSAMQGWRYPYHFIDFETARVALPFFAGQRPYANVAFQFSHHTLDEAGHIAHANQFLSLEPGVSPNLNFVRALRSALAGDQGTVFMWSPHENTTLLDLMREIEEMEPPPPDRAELVQFIRSITVQKQADGSILRGERAMVDLCVIARKAYFHPSTRGACSIKKVLPAVMASSDHLRKVFSQPIYGAAGGIPSLNFKDWVWWRSAPAGALSPYGLLPPIFDDVGLPDSDGSDSGDDVSLADGGAATTAWARMQFEQTSSVERAAVEGALLRYCELDTLAMVMVMTAWINS